MHDSEHVQDAYIISEQYIITHYTRKQKFYTLWSNIITARLVLPLFRIVFIGHKCIANSFILIVLLHENKYKFESDALWLSNIIR